jgi:hypothetical protein
MRFPLKTGKKSGPLLSSVSALTTGPRLKMDDPVLQIFKYLFTFPTIQGKKIFKCPSAKTIHQAKFFLKGHMNRKNAEYN